MAESLAEFAKQGSRRLTILGIAVVILGVLSLLAPLVTGLTISVLVGVLLLAAGVARMVWAFGAGSFGRGLLAFLLGALSVGAGLLMLSRPLLGLATIALVLAAYFVVDGVVEIVAAFRARPRRGWGWLLFGGIASLLLGILIYEQWPISGVWAVGVLVGIRLLFAGWGMIGLGAVVGHASEVRAH
jgi:uncharacterized membrane protein HdeD (DUF308 family)